MASHLCLAVRFLAPAFHGRRDGDEPEWPPSPMRLFQSLVNAASARWRGGPLAPHARVSLEWLEKQPPPVLVAPRGVSASGYRLSVPNNSMDIVARAWSRGNYSNIGDSNPATHRTMKPVRPVLLLAGDAVNYVWVLPDPISTEVRGCIETLREIVRSVVCLGWGIDMALGNGEILSGEEINNLSGERWLPYNVGIAGLRVPISGTLNDLTERHKSRLARLKPEGLAPPTPLSAYQMIEYRRAIDPPPRSIAAFSLLNLDASGFRFFDPVRRTSTVAQMVRGAARRAAKQAGWPESKIDQVIMGHGEPRGESGHVPVTTARFAWLPLPSLEPRSEGKTRVAGGIRRVIITSFGEDLGAEVAWVRRALAGEDLTGSDIARPEALLSLLPKTDKMVSQYTRSAATWATVTPVVLPGYDDPDHYRRRLKNGVTADDQKRYLGRLDWRIGGLLRKAISQAGFSEVLAEHAQLEWRATGFWPGVDLASRYTVPDHLRRFPRLHVQISWRDGEDRPIDISGPVCIGGGRFYGLGLFAVV
jgi:CRISPR-associated protein Csb2